ncbi:MAG: LysR substrate-binding domain-containing protein [Rhizobiaceae bacterium]
MPRSLPPLNAIRAFEAAGRHESFSAAASELNVSHAAISRHVRGLERRLGVQLFRNVVRGVALTDAGRDLLAEVTPALDRIAEAASNVADATSGLVSVTCESTFAVKWLMPRIGRFNRLFPDVEIDLDASSSLASISGYEFDVGLRYCKRTPQELEYDLICRRPVYPVGTPEIAQWPPAEHRPGMLQDYRLLREDDGTLWRRWFEHAGVEQFSLPKQHGKLSGLLAIEAVLAGQGLALMSDELIADDIAAGRLVCYSDIGFDYGAYYLVYRRETIRRREVRGFRDWLLDVSAPLRDA